MALPVIHTKRLVLRPWTHQDVDALHALWTAPGVRRYLWDDVIIPRSTVQEIVDSHLATAEHQAIGYWTLHLPDPPIAGFCGFRPIDGGPEIELLYALDPQHWGKGLATEACLGAIEYLWRRHRISTGVRPHRPPEQSIHPSHPALRHVA